MLVSPGDAAAESVVVRPVPISSMSGSFQWPGPAYCARVEFAVKLLSMLEKLGLISPVVRHRLEMGAAHL
jgi:hypothetical protein